MGRIFEIAKFEYLKIIKTVSFWAATLFFPIFMALIMVISGFSSIQANKKAQEGSNLTKIYILDEVGIIPNNLISEPLEKITDIKLVENDVKEDSSKVIIHLPKDFLKSLKYKVYQKETGDLMRMANIPILMESLIKSSAIESIQDEKSKLLLSGKISSETFSYQDDGNVVKQGFDKYVLPILSMVVFFVTVYISSSYLLQSVSSEKENRMIETMLSIVDKKSLMLGKMIGLMLVVITQLMVWLILGIVIFTVASKYTEINLPFDIAKIDWSTLPYSIFFIFTGFLFFGAIMMGTGAIGTGAEDSRNLSSIFIMLSIAPIYVIQSILLDPNSSVSKVFTYFPFSSYMVMMIRKSLGTLPDNELILGMVLCLLYVIIAILIAYKLFELGCLMYNRRASSKEMIEFLFRKKLS
ncbi:MAG TPA: ABC transporter permease [Candidatus Dojkabacteria bacterium]|nr:ABC transporter permease [Candidatus Dojkabacteria bacterium]